MTTIRPAFPTIIYVASYVTHGDYDAWRDDFPLMIDLANGFVAAAGPDRERVLARTKQLLTEEMIDVEEMTKDDELTYFPDEEDPNSIRVDCGADPVAHIVIRELEEA